MRTMKSKHVMLLCLFALLSLVVLLPGVALATGSGPIVVPGNPDCEDLGYTYGFKPNIPSEESPYGTHTIPGTSETITITQNNFFNWTSTLGIDAVIVKGGDNANVYTYDPESFGDNDLITPTNPANGKPFGLSHVEFCYDFEVKVTKDAQTTYVRTFTWQIDKSVDIAEHNLETGQSGTSTYTVTLTQNVADTDFAVSGNIYIYNPDPNYTANIVSVTDDAGGVAATVNCPAMTVAPGDTLTCTYSAGPLTPNTFGGTNTATVTTSGKVGGGSGTYPIVFGDPTTIVGYPTVTVSDTYKGDLGSFSGSGSTTYSRTFTCDGDKGTRDNTATINETGQSDDASVTVNCTPPPPPPPGDQWCSPGYWRQEHHLDSWPTTISPDDPFVDALGYAPTLSRKGERDGATTNPTLWEVLQNPQWYGGDDFNAVGDLLSAAHPDVNFTGERVEDSCPLN